MILGGCWQGQNQAFSSQGSRGSECSSSLKAIVKSSRLVARGTHCPAVRAQAPGTARGSHSVGACPLSCAGVSCSRSLTVPFMTQQKSVVALWPPALVALAAQGCLLPWLCHPTLSSPLIQLCDVQCKALLQGEGLLQEVWKNDPGLFSASTIDGSPRITP